jgi:hypothetical protein
MSSKTEISYADKHLKGKYVKVSGHTNLRKSPSLHCASQGVVEKGKMLKLTGRTGFDDRHCLWFEVCYKGKKLWLSMWYIQTKPNDVAIQLYDKDGNKVDYND